MQGLVSGAQGKAGPTGGGQGAGMEGCKVGGPRGGGRQILEGTQETAHKTSKSKRGDGKENGQETVG